MMTGQRKTTSYCGQTSCTLLNVFASIDNRKHVAKTQARLAGVFTNLETPRKTPRECFSHVQKKLEEINFRKELACAEAQLKKRQNEKAQGWLNNPEVVHDCQK